MGYDGSEVPEEEEDDCTCIFCLGDDEAKYLPGLHYTTEEEWRREEIAAVEALELYTALDTALMNRQSHVSTETLIAALAEDEEAFQMFRAELHD